MGKSRLAREVAGAAEAAGVTVLVGRAVPAGEPYRPLVEAIDRGAAGASGLPDDDDAAALPPRARGGAAGRRRSPAGWTPRGGVVLGEAGAAADLAALAGPSGARSLVLEDLHWVDPDTLDRADVPGARGRVRPR